MESFAFNDMQNSYTDIIIFKNYRNMASHLSNS